jgi:hypothetical protein
LRDFGSVIKGKEKICHLISSCTRDEQKVEAQIGEPRSSPLTNVRGEDEDHVTGGI